MAKNHYVTKRNRRPVSGKRNDTKRIADTMRKLKEHAQKQAAAESKAVVEEALAPLLLKNGSQEPKAVVAVTMMGLRDLIQKYPIAFYELVMVSRDPSHRIFGNNAQILSKFNLAREDGHVHNSIRNVVISAVEGENIDMVLRSPVALEPKIEAELAALAQKKDEDIDTSDIPEVTDWSKAEVGKFYRG